MWKINYKQQINRKQLLSKLNLAGLYKYLDKSLDKPLADCIFCLSGKGAGGACDACLYSLPVITRSCRICAEPLEYSLKGTKGKWGISDGYEESIKKLKTTSEEEEHSSFISASSYPVTNIISAKNGKHICASCYIKSSPLTMAWAPFPYYSPLNKALHNLKFNKLMYYAKTLGNLWLHAYINNPVFNNSPSLFIKEFAPDLILPMPLHQSRIAKRGFNQSFELSKPLARFLQIPLSYGVHGLCYRIKDTVPQYDLSPQQRHKNLKNAFALNPSLNFNKVIGNKVIRKRRVKQPLQGMNILIMDDVITSAVTINELAYVLKRAGANKIAAWSLLRA